LLEGKQSICIVVFDSYLAALNIFHGGIMYQASGSVPKRFASIIPLLIICFLLLVAILPIQVPGRQAVAYIDPDIYKVTSGTVNVIVTATDTAAAEQAVVQMGGKVISESNLANSVGAEIPVSRISAMRYHTKVKSISLNQGLALR
jgi:hypothetical protein